MNSIIIKICLLVLIAHSYSPIRSQNSLVGDGFGGRLWYQPTNYSVGSYSGFTVCKEDESNQLYGWGANSNGELGIDPNILMGSDSPVEIQGATNLKFYTTGYVMGAIKNDNSGWAWGGEFSTAPVKVISDVNFVDAAMTHMAFVKEDGTVWSIGEGAYGNFGNGTDSSSLLAPVQMSNINTAVRVACSVRSTFILLDDGKVYMTGIFGSTQATLPLEIPDLTTVVDIKATSSGFLALKSNGEVYYLSGSAQSIIPLRIEGISNIIAISGMCDGYEFLLLDEDKNCYSLYDPISFLPLPVATDVIDILAGETFSYIVKTGGTLWGKGSSYTGSIWLNLSNEPREQYTRMNPAVFPNLCSVDINDSNTEPGNSIEPVFIPNVFTPNGDGANDLFSITYANVIEANCIILNRWGQTIIELKDAHDSWDGMINGSKATEGVYFYHLTYRLANNSSETKHGFFHLE